VENISGLLYKEEQNFPAWFYLLFFLWIPFIVIVFVINPELFKESDFMLAILLAVLFEFLIIALMGKLTILVRWIKCTTKNSNSHLIKHCYFSFL